MRSGSRSKRETNSNSSRCSSRSRSRRGRKLKRLWRRYRKRRGRRSRDVVIIQTDRLVKQDNGPVTPSQREEERREECLVV